LIYFENGYAYRYRGNRTVEDFTEFIEKKDFKKITGEDKLKYPHRKMGMELFMIRLKASLRTLHQFGLS